MQEDNVVITATEIIQAEHERRALRFRRGSGVDQGPAECRLLGRLGAHDIQ
jgi:hypothetical protein